MLHDYIISPIHLQFDGENVVDDVLLTQSQSNFQPRWRFLQASRSIAIDSQALNEYIRSS